MTRRLETPLTRHFAIEHPILLAPMDLVSGGRLAAAVSAAGGLGLLGGGYGNAEWLRREFEAAGNQRIGAGFITWSLARQPELLDLAIAHRPRAVMFSFGDASEFVRKVKGHGISTLWQVQRLEQAEMALKAGVEAIVVQGQEGGGHGMDRGLVSLLPAVRDLAGPEQLVVAAGGLADGRGLAAALLLGADGIMMGTRFWASEEASGSAAAKARLVAARGDETLRTKVFDVARGADWPWEFTGRVVGNAFSRRWHGQIEELKRRAEEERAAYRSAKPEDFDIRVLIAGESLDLIASIEAAADIVETTAREAVALLSAAPARYLA